MTCGLLRLHSRSLLRFLVISVSYGAFFERSLARCDFAHEIRCCIVGLLIDITGVSTDFINNFRALTLTIRLLFNESFLGIFDLPRRLPRISLQEAIHVGLAKPIWTRHFLPETFFSRRRIVHTDCNSHLWCYAIKNMVDAAVYMFLLTKWLLTQHPLVNFIHLFFTTVYFEG